MIKLIPGTIKSVMPPKHKVNTTEDRDDSGLKDFIEGLPRSRSEIVSGEVENRQNINYHSDHWKRKGMETSRKKDRSKASLNKRIEEDETLRKQHTDCSLIDDKNYLSAVASLTKRSGKSRPLRAVPDP
jgi:hypothetical protein